MIHKLEFIGHGIWVVFLNMLVESSEKHSIRESHVATLGHAYHSMGDVIGKIEGFPNEETIEHIAQACVWVIFVSDKAYDIFTKNEFPFLEHFFQFDVNHLEWIKDAFVTFYYSVLGFGSFLENMNDYRDEGMGDIIFGEPFLREGGIKIRRFEGMITIYNGDDEVSYQMVQSHPRFKYHTNEQCNKIPPLLKVSEEDKMNGISHPYQKLKGFYKGVLNLGPDYIRDAKMEEWLTRGHISVHEIK
ncbi:hypothetical protein Tco_0150701 [Tanacetum coccineum]